MKAKDLRNSILQMAVQGKLVPQDPNDEPASVLLERIRKERAKLIKEKKIRAPKGGESVIYRASDGSHYEKRGGGEPVCIDDEIPFDIPESWEWCRFSSLNLGSFTGPFGSALHKSDYVSEGIPVVNPADIVQGHVVAGKMVSSLTRDRLSSYVLASGDFIIGRRGEMGRAAIISDDEDGWLCGTGCFFAHMPQQVTPDYWRLLFSSPLVVNQLESKSVGTTMKNLNLDILGNLLIPMPPCGEQPRICLQAYKAFEVTDQCGALEDARERLDAELPGRLRKSILQMAVQGRLVEQDPADEPASELLKRIRAERAALVKAKKVKAPKGGESVIFRASDGGYYEKRGKGEPVCIDDEIPFDIPESWEWVRLPEVADLRIGKTPSRHDERYWTNGHYPWFSISDMSDAQTITHSKESISDAAMADCFKGGVSPAGTLLMSFKLTIGKTSILGVDAVHNEAIVSVIPHLDQEDTLRDYLLYALPFAAQNGDFKGAIKGNTLNSKSMSMLLIPLPSLCEQRRIVCRLVELLQTLTNQ